MFYAHNLHVFTNFDGDIIVSPFTHSVLPMLRYHDIPIKGFWTFFALIIPLISLSQPFTITGSVSDELTRKPVSGANIRIYGTSRGTSTGSDGYFTLVSDALPVTFVISCVGYEKTFIDLLEKPGKSIRFFIKPVSYDLQEVEISPSDHRFIFRNQNYSVLDYEISNELLFLLVTRGLGREAEMVVLNLSGDTLATAPLPEIPPLKICRDFLSNIHYYSARGTTYQCNADTDNETVDFLYPVPFDSLEKYIRPFLFRIGDRIYFQQKILNNFGTRIGYGSRDSGQVFFKDFINTRKITELRDDRSFYYQWNNGYQTIRAGSLPQKSDDGLPDDPAFDFSSSRAEEGSYGSFESAAHWIEFYNMRYPFIRINDDTLVFIDFSNSTMELMNRDGKILKKNDITFHREDQGLAENKADDNGNPVSSGWRWGNLILQDDSTRFLYTIYQRTGMIKLCRVDYRTGKLTAETMIPFPFPEKFRIFNQRVYYLCKPAGIGETRRLIRSRLN
ncbi:MAG: carboxypeptidase-like regulatory domain-containing protein [Alphaproteobacteria bacterium]|nr:carboxypeptidase-like regulatory domain-containing protein [Alphaproteobacteria bacterium]